MSEIIFVKVRNDQGAAYEYDPEHAGGSASYTDAWALVRLSGFKTCEMGEVDFDSDHVYIFWPANGNSKAAFSRPHRCTLIHWNIERPGIEVEDYVDEMWVSDKFQMQLASHHSRKVRFVPLGGHKDLGGAPRHPKMWDFATLAYHDGKRAAQFAGLVSRGFTLSPSSIEPQPKEIILAHSRWGLMLFQDFHPIITPLRAVLYACWKLPIVAEPCQDTFPYKFIPYEPDMRTLLAMDEGFVRDVVEDNYAMVTKTLTFRTCVEKAVDALSTEVSQ